MRSLLYFVVDMHLSLSFVLGEPRDVSCAARSLQVDTFCSGLVIALDGS
jgi:hypothetical protein